MGRGNARPQRSVYQTDPACGFTSMRTAMHATGATTKMQGTHLVPEHVHCQLSGCDGVTGVQVVKDIKLRSAVHHEYRSNHVCQLIHLHAETSCQRLQSHGLRLSCKAGAFRRYRQNVSLATLLDSAGEKDVHACYPIRDVQDSRSTGRNTRCKDRVIQACTWVS